ncbi:MAG: cytochrome b/b6 domain-containing protein [Anaerolineae bacterium]|nr:cytochrome b/b6 domain-containing protein [Anaerolineae bacterium]
MAQDTLTNQPQRIERPRYTRFSPAQRFEHLVLLVAVLGLALTGLPQRFNDQAWAQTLIKGLGGIESLRIVHRFMAALLMAEVIYHIGVISYKLYVLRQPASLLPRARDVRDLVDWIRYSLGLRSAPPAMPRYNFGDKLKYWGVAISVIILLITGLILWNPISAARVLSGETIPAAQVIHSDQAWLTVVILVIWYMYSILFRRPNFSMFTGKLSRAAMLEDHAQELERIECGAVPILPSKEAVADRRRAFMRVAAVIGIIVVGVLARYLTTEQSAITTVPRHEEAIFAPRAQPSTGEANVGAALWPTLRCAFCHGPQARGGPDGAPALRGTTMSFEKFYTQVRNGTDKMPAFRPDELPDGYLTHLWTWLSTTPKDVLIRNAKP